MTGSDFLKGMGMGVAVGATVGRMFPRRKHVMKKRTLGKAVKTASKVMDELSGIMDM